MRKVAAIIVAGGSGSRMGSSIKKQYLKICGKEVLAHTVQVFENIEEIQEIIIVTGKEDLVFVEQMLKGTYKSKKITQVVEGGAERQYSVYNGLQCMSENVEYVLIHDGARPLITTEVIQSSLEKVYEVGACIVAVPVKDTIKVANSSLKVKDTPKREMLWSVQTPQVFSRELIMRAHEEARKNNLLGTDDSMLVEALGEAVYIVPGEYTNIKITTPEDLIIAERLIQ